MSFEQLSSEQLSSDQFPAALCRGGEDRNVGFMTQGAATKGSGKVAVSKKDCALLAQQDDLEWEHREVTSMQSLMYGAAMRDAFA